MTRLLRENGKRLIIAGAAFLLCMLLTGCKPVLSLNPEYSYTEFDLELGQDMPADIEEYVDFSELSEEDAQFVRDNTKILFDGEEGKQENFRSAGKHTLTIQYCGKQYREYRILVTDSIPPEFTKTKNAYTFIGLPLAKDTAKSLFKAKDNSGKVRVKISEDNVDYYKVGKYKVTATATDPSGNKTTADAYIVVQAPGYGAIGTYVYINIAKQHLTYFRDGKAVMDCPVVTGNSPGSHATPKGSYTLNYKSRNVKLVGREDNGDKYESFVSYWMAFIGSSVGMHDATWRSNFGGEIYKGGGSHGCVNMPYKDAAKLYELIEPGTPVLVY